MNCVDGVQTMTVRVDITYVIIKHFVSSRVNKLSVSVPPIALTTFNRSVTSFIAWRAACQSLFSQSFCPNLSAYNVSEKN